MAKKDISGLSKTSTSFDMCYQDIVKIINASRSAIASYINVAMVDTYWHIGRRIVEIEQQGAARADYGEKLIVSLAERLTVDFGKGFSTTLLKRVRKFYLCYPKGATAWPLSLSSENSSDITSEKGATLSHLSQVHMPKWKLSWSHYRLLTTLDNEGQRSFYECEAAQNAWSVRELTRQINSFLYERLSKSKDKSAVLALARKGQEITNPKDALKDPYIFEFLGFPEGHLVKESDLEQALINNLQSFLLELGKGFSFVARQKRLALDGLNLYVDLVMYHTVLKCFILIDLKIDTITHADLGQMQVYVNYYDKECRSEDDNPTIGLILCPNSHDQLVQYFIGDNAQRIFASRYRLHLPTEEELSAELKRELSYLQEQMQDI